MRHQRAEAWAKWRAVIPDDNDALKETVCSLLLKQDAEKHRAEERQCRADDLHIGNLGLRVELARYKKWYYGPR